jgi:hypothetical protein
MTISATSITHQDSSPSNTKSFFGPMFSTKFGTTFGTVALIVGSSLLFNACTPELPKTGLKVTGTIGLGAAFENPNLERATLDNTILVLVPLKEGNVDASGVQAQTMTVSQTPGSFGATSARYSFENAPVGQVLLLAVKDLNQNKSLDAGEYIGAYSSDGSTLTALTVPLETADLDVDKASGGLDAAFTGKSTPAMLEAVRGVLKSLLAYPPAKPALPTDGLK